MHKWKYKWKYKWKHKWKQPQRWLASVLERRGGNHLRAASHATL